MLREKHIVKHVAFSLLFMGCIMQQDIETPLPFPLPFDLMPEAVCTNGKSSEWTNLGLSNETVLSILVHPKNPQVIFAGTGFDFSAQRDGKIFRSMDCGDTWEKVHEGGHFRGLLLHPSEPYTLFAWDHNPTGGLLRSTDGGTSWHLHSDGMHTDGRNRTSVLLIHPNTPRIMYASTAGFWSGGVYKSTNGGHNWENITENHWPILASGATAMFMHPEQPELLLHSADGNSFISRTEDGGKTWEDVFYAEGHVSAYALHPQNPNQIFAIASRRGLLISDDRGKEWRVQEISDPPRRYRDLIFVRNKLYIASEGAVLRTEDLHIYIKFNEGIDFGLSAEGHTLTLPKTLSIDVNQGNLYLGHEYVPINGKKIGGVYVRKLDH